MDEDTILASVQNMGRLVIVREAPARGGFGGEIAPVVASKAIGFLDAPIQRVGAPCLPVPVSPILEEAYLPKKEGIVQAALGNAIGIEA